MALVSLYDGLEIQVLVDHISDTDVIFSFSGFEAHKTDKPAYGNGFIQKNGFTAVFFISKVSHWWQSIELDEAISFVQDYTKKFTNRITYGQSMGGYGALLTCGKLDSFFIVTAPQTVITDKSVPLHPVWLEHIDKFPLIRDNVKEEIDHSRGGIVIFDPLCDMDYKHFLYISKNPKVFKIIVPFGTHYIPRCLSEMGVFSEVMSNLIHYKQKNINNIRVKIRTKRFLSPLYVENICSFMLKRKNIFLNEYLHKYLEKKLLDVKLLNYDLSYVFDIIASNKLLECNLMVYNFYIDNICFISLNNDTKLINERNKILRSTGVDPAFTFDVMHVSPFEKIIFHMYSSVNCNATIYYIFSESEHNKFSEKKCLRAKVKIGLNALIFDFSGLSIKPILRFDPIRSLGDFKIINIEFL